MILKHRYNIFPERNGIRFRIKWDSSKCIVNFNIPLKIDKAKWSTDTMRCKNNSYHDGISAAEINKEINRMEQLAEDIFAEYSSNDIMPTEEQLKADMNAALGKTTKKKDTSILHYFDEFVAEETIRKNWSRGTILKFNAIRKQLENLGGDKLDLNDLNDDFLQLYVSSFISGGYNNTTSKKKLQFLKWYIRWLVRKGYYDGQVLTSFSARLKGTEIAQNEVIYLNWNELQHLYSMPIENKALEQVRDVFCFCCFTSLRYSDVAKLQKSDVHDDCIKVVTQKTYEPLTIELNKYSRAILDKYRYEALPDSLALPVISNQKMNDRLKELAKLAELHTPIRRVYFVGNERKEEIHEKWELITTHCGRRTFIVNALFLGIPGEVVMKWTGHADYKAMKPYIAIVDELKQSSMEKFNMR